MAAFGLSSFSFVFLMAQVDFPCWTFSSLSSQFCALVRWIKLIKNATNAIGFKNVILLHSDNRHVSAAQCDHLQGVDISTLYNKVLFFSIHTDGIKHICETKLHNYVSFLGYIIDAMLTYINTVYLLSET
jgi:hypothetical protein